MLGEGSLKNLFINWFAYLHCVDHWIPGLHIKSNEKKFAKASRQASYSGIWHVLYRAKG
jgi:hypothetical protein